MLPRRPPGRAVEVEEIVGHMVELAAPVLAPGNARRWEGGRSRAL